MFKLIPRTLALRAVQRHTAASVSTSPTRSEQQGLTAGEPTTTLIRLRTSAHTPNFKASLGHVAGEPEGLGVGFGDGFGDGFGEGLGLCLGVVGVGQVPQAVMTVKNRMLSVRKRASVTVLLLVDDIVDRYEENEHLTLREREIREDY
ncbi:hypothetical protein QQ045_027856 [Rhodiola kirilowii]